MLKIQRHRITQGTEGKTKKWRDYLSCKPQTTTVDTNVKDESSSCVNQQRRSEREQIKGKAQLIHEHEDGGEHDLS